MNASLIRAIKDFVALFESRGLTYAILGGLAARAHGIPRPTWDVDFAIGIDRDALPELFEAAESLGYVVPAAYRSGWVDAVQGMPIVKFGVAISDRSVDVDIFLAESLFLKTVLSRRQHADVDENLQVAVVSPEDLIVLKVLAGRPRDAIDVQDVLFMQGELDRDYMKHWAERLGVLENLEMALGKFDEEMPDRL